MRKKELRVREKEAENTAKEIEMLSRKAEAEADERKKLTDLLMQLATQK